MRPTAFRRPDVLVLAAGGILGEAWMSGLLAGIEDATGTDFRSADSFVGTSAGAIVSARLASGRRLRRPPAKDRIAVPPDAPPSDEGFLGLLTSSLGAFAGPALRLEVVPGALLRTGALRALPDGRRSLADLERSVSRDGARFDGRLRVVCVERATGRRVIFGSPDAPPATVGRAVAASCAIPTYYQPVRIGNREYVDGGAWSQTNLDAAPVGRRTRVLCLNPLVGLPASLSSPASAARALAQARQGLELAALRRRGALVEVLGPGPSAPLAAMSGNLMDSSRAAAVLAAAYAQGLALA